MKYAKVYFEDLSSGTEMPPLVKAPLQQIQLTRYASASGDFNPLHQDEAFARAAGMKGVIAHGMLSMAFVAQAITDWLGPGTISKISMRFAHPVRIGDVITCRGRVVEKRASDGGRDSNEIDLELVVENDRAQSVATSLATAALASRIG